MAEYDQVKERARYLARRDAAVAPMRVRRFGITPERYAEMFANQSGCCAICEQPEAQFRAGRRKFLAVDHDHSCCPGDTSCGVCVRQLLCANCNNLLGRAADDPMYLVKAGLYLRHHQEGSVAIAI